MLCCMSMLGGAELCGSSIFVHNFKHDACTRNGLGFANLLRLLPSCAPPRDTNARPPPGEDFALTLAGSCSHVRCGAHMHRSRMFSPFVSLRARCRKSAVEEKRGNGILVHSVEVKNILSKYHGVVRKQKLDKIKLEQQSGVWGTPPSTSPALLLKRRRDHTSACQKVIFGHKVIFQTPHGLSCASTS